MKNNLLFLFIFLSQLSFAQTFDVDTILWSGPTDKRINLVILGDGYQENELSQFSNDANNFSTSLFSQTPYKEYKNYFNVFIIKVPSNESGASHPGTATDVVEPDHPVSVVDNYFGSTFDAFNIHRLLVVDNTSAVNNVLASNFPTYDQVLILTNSPHYGGSGGQIPVASLATGSEEIAIHELGHSFVNLRDEYFAGSVFSAESINMTQETDPNNVKWKNWMNTDGIGIYQHCCGGNSSDWYKPHQDCKMQFLGSPFCAVCIEGTIEKIHSLVDIIDSYTPQNSAVIDLTSPITFSADLVEPVPNSLNIEWILNGTTMNNSTNTISLEANDLLTGSNQLQLTVADTTTLLRIENHQTIHFASVLWDINSNSVSINNINSYKLKIELFPNPTQEVLHFNITNELKEDFTVTINDVIGNQLISKKFNSPEYNSQIQTGDIPSGVYFINFNFGENLSITRKIIKE